MKHKKQLFIVLFLMAVIAAFQCTKTQKIEKENPETASNALSKNGKAKKDIIEDGKQIFRFDAFGDEDFWSGLLHIDKAIAGSKNGGFGAGVSPKTALAVGLKVDVEALT